MAKDFSERVCLPAGGSVLDQIVNFAISMIQVESDDPAIKAAPQGWVVWHAIAEGRVGFYDADSPALRGWWIYGGREVTDRYGQPAEAIFRTDGTYMNTLQKTIETDPSKRGMKVLRANPTGTPPILQMRRDAVRIEAAYSMLDANLRAAKRTQIIECDKGQKASIEVLLDRQLIGDPAIVERDIIGTVSTIDISTPFVGADVHTLIGNLWADALRRWGGVTPPQYKAERTQSAEVSASVAESIDNIYIMLDTLNADAERVGVPVKFVYRGYGAMFDGEPEQPAPEEIEEEEETENE